MKVGANAGDAVHRALRSYADRGVFRGFSCRERARGRCEFSFRWLADADFTLVFDPEKRELTIRDLLPNVPYRSDMDRAFRAFLRERADASLPAHRRFDPEQLSLRCTNRAGRISITASVHDGDFDRATRRSISLVNEVFHGFLRGPYFDYMVENFGEPEE